MAADVLAVAGGLAVLLQNFAATNDIQIFDLDNSNNNLLEFKCNFIWLWPNCDLYFSFLFSCYFSRNQNGKGSSYGLLFSHVETILVMVSKESFTVSGFIIMYVPVG